MKKIFFSIFTIFAALSLLSACSGTDNNAPIGPDSTVKLHYALTVEGQVIDDSHNREPIEFTIGTGQGLPGLENKIQGMVAGEKASFTLSPEEGFGIRNEEAIAEVPKTAFGDGAEFQPGTFFTGQAPDGSPVKGMIAEVKEETVIVDFNHPFADKEVSVDLEILEVS